MASEHEVAEMRARAKELGWEEIPDSARRGFDTVMELRDGKLYAQTAEKLNWKGDAFYGLVTERVICQDHQAAADQACQNCGDDQ